MPRSRTYAVQECIRSRRAVECLLRTVAVVAGFRSSAKQMLGRMSATTQRAQQNRKGQDVIHEYARLVDGIWLAVCAVIGAKLLRCSGYCPGCVSYSDEDSRTLEAGDEFSPQGFYDRSLHEGG
jgi:hypothetical protein